VRTTHRFSLGVKSIASDQRTHREMARKMFTMTEEISAKSGDGKERVTCFTWPRGAEHPANDVPKP
jgi:hypothetical protein